MKWFEKKKAEATALRDSNLEEQKKAGLSIVLNE